MRRPVITPQWRGRLVGGALLGVLAYAVSVLLDFDPQPVAFVVVVVIACAMAFLVVDTVDAPAAVWQPGLPASDDRVDEATSDLRILSSHQQADHPSEALAMRLVALARTRDADLAEEVRRELDGVRRIAPTDIDRILTRIEDVHGRQ